MQSACQRQCPVTRPQIQYTLQHRTSQEGHLLVPLQRIVSWKAGECAWGACISGQQGEDGEREEQALLMLQRELSRLQPAPREHSRLQPQRPPARDAADPGALGQAVGSGRGFARVLGPPTHTPPPPHAVAGEGQPQGRSGHPNPVCHPPPLHPLRMHPPAGAGASAASAFAAAHSAQPQSPAAPLLEPHAGGAGAARPGGQGLVAAVGMPVGLLRTPDTRAAQGEAAAPRQDAAAPLRGSTGAPEAASAGDLGAERAADAARAIWQRGLSGISEGGSGGSLRRASAAGPSARPGGPDEAAAGAAPARSGSRSGSGTLLRTGTIGPFHAGDLHGAACSSGGGGGALGTSPFMVPDVAQPPSFSARWPPGEARPPAPAPSGARIPAVGARWLRHASGVQLGDEAGLGFGGDAGGPRTGPASARPGSAARRSTAALVQRQPTRDGERGDTAGSDGGAGGVLRLLATRVGLLDAPAPAAPPQGREAVPRRQSAAEALLTDQLRAGKARALPGAAGERAGGWEIARLLVVLSVRRAIHRRNVTCHLMWASEGHAAHLQQQRTSLACSSIAGMRLRLRPPSQPRAPRRPRSR